MNASTKAAFAYGLIRKLIAGLPPEDREQVGCWLLRSPLVVRTSYGPHDPVEVPDRIGKALREHSGFSKPWITSMGSIDTPDTAALFGEREFIRVTAIDLENGINSKNRRTWLFGDCNEGVFVIHGDDGEDQFAPFLGRCGVTITGEDDALRVAGAYAALCHRGQVRKASAAPTDKGYVVKGELANQALARDSQESKRSFELKIVTAKDGEVAALNLKPPVPEPGQ